jgi:hypothetical protein
MHDFAYSNPLSNCFFQNRLSLYNVNSNLALIETHTSNLLIDTSLLGVFPHRLKSLYQFIGELQPLPDKEKGQFPTAPRLQLKARIIRNVDGIDTALYDKVLDAWRQFDTTRHSLGY